MDRAKQWGPSPVKFVEMTEDSSLSGGISRDELRALGADTISDALGLEVLEVEHGRVVGRLPVDARTHQPYGLLHGGASVVLAETLGSVGSHFIAAPKGKGAVGIEVNANRLASTTKEGGCMSGTSTSRTTKAGRSAPAG